METTAQVAAFNTRIEADVAVARLESAGIRSFVSADNLGGTFPMMQMTTGGFKVNVRSTDRTAATATIDNHFPNVESRPRAQVSTLQRFARAVSSPRATRVRVALFVVLVFAAVLAVALSTTQGTL